MSTPQPEAKHWHRPGIEEVAQQLGTTLERGLSAAEVASRLEKFGPNALREAPTKSPLRIFAAQFADFMVIVLLVAAVIAGFLGEPEDTIAIAAIVVLNAVIGFVQEYRAERAMAMLRQLAAHQAHVVRDGDAATVPSSELVPGDIVLLEAGASVPADLRIGEAAQLRVEEAALTGESQPVEKHTRPIEDGDVALGDRKNMAYKGTMVTYGRGRAIVVETGMQTELGRIATLLEEAESVKTPLQKRLAQFGKTLAMAALGICGIVFAVGVQRGEPMVRMFLTSISLAVAAIPEALPAVVTIALALGARRMLKVNALVRRLPAVETLGSVTYICTDKTGTLTENRMRMTGAHVTGDESLFYTALALNNDAAVDSQGAVTGDPTEVALLDAAREKGFDKGALEKQSPRIDELPFDSERKRMTTVHRIDGGTRSFTKGAPESVLDLCDAMLTREGEAPIDRQGIEDAAAKMASEGLRVLAFAYNRSGEAKESDLVFLGLAGLIDPPRAEAREAVRVCKEAGITPVMITGDHPLTAKAIAAQLGIDEANVHARVDPTEKLRIVEKLQKDGEFVAMTGDGVNDAPALKKSDIGVAMGRGGTDVAREASDLVLLDDNFATIVGAVREGRHIYDNIRKFIKFVLASNSAEILTIFTAPLLGLPVPLLPIHILWVNLVTDGLPGLALAAEPEDPNIMRRPPRPPNESMFSHGLWQHTIWVGMLIAGLSIFSQAYEIEQGSDHWQTVVFTTLALAQMAHVLAVRSERESTFKLGFFSNLPLVGAVALTVALQMAVIYVPVLQGIFETAPLTLAELGLVTALCSTVFVAVEIEKWMTRRGWLYKDSAKRPTG